MDDREQVLRKVKEAFAETAGVEEAKGLVAEALVVASPLDVVHKMREGLEVVGKKYEDGELFLSELIMAGLMATEVVGMLKPQLQAMGERSKGKVAIGTVKGDIHDIGKTILGMMLTSAGFEVEDLGVDVPVEKFVDAVREKKPSILGMSCLLTIGMDELGKVVAKLEKEGLRRRVKVLVGGRPLTPEFAASIGADGYAKDAVEAIRVAEQLVRR